ncbi:MAG: PhoU domain-containing protein [Lachnospiraceae bacterium]
MEAVREEINITCNAFLNDDKEAAQRVAPLGVVITHLCDELKMHHVERLSNGNCGLEEGTVFNDILNSFGRIAAHIVQVPWQHLMKSGEQDAGSRISAIQDLSDGQLGVLHILQRVQKEI